MYISCEKCSTTYILDDALIPTEGTPVQCTRCQHVFTARLPTADVQPQPTHQDQEPANVAASSSPPLEAPDSHINQTMMFGVANPPPQPVKPPETATPWQSEPASHPEYNQTIAFGSRMQQAEPQPPMPEQAAGVQPDKQTQDDESQNAESTVRIDAEAIMREQEARGIQTSSGALHQQQYVRPPSSTQGYSRTPAVAPHGNTNLPRAELPPEPSVASKPPVFRPAHHMHSSTYAFEGSNDLEQSTNRRAWIIVTIFLMAVLAIGLALAWHLFGRSVFGTAVTDAVTRSKVEQAVALLRMDDSETRTRAMTELKSILKEIPELTIARAALLLAHSFSYDDAGVLAFALKRRNTVNAAQTQKISEQRIAAEEALTSELEALEKLQLPQGSPEHMAVLRAKAVAYGVLGDARALELGEQHRQLSREADNWADLAMPEYVVTNGTSIDEALAQLEIVRNRKSNSTFFRALVLSARLHIKAGNVAVAEELLKMVTTLNSKHEVAHQLLNFLMEQENPVSTQDELWQ